jgi:hypothetical protein
LLIFASAGFFAIPYVFAVSAEMVDYFEPWDNEKHMENAVSFEHFNSYVLCFR